MDPFSVASGIIGILAATDQAHKCLKKLRSIRNAHGEIIEVAEEVADIRRTLEEVSQLIAAARQSGIPWPYEIVETLDDIGRRMTHKLNVLTNLIPSCAFESEGGQVDTKYNYNHTLKFAKQERWSWSRNRPQVVKIREDLQKLQLNVLVKVSLISASTGVQSHRLPGASVSIPSIDQEPETTTPISLLEGSDSTHNEAQLVRSNLDSRERQLLLGAEGMGTGVGQSCSTGKPPNEVHIPNITNASSPPAFEHTQTWKRRLQIQTGFGNLCEEFCSCSCHKEAYLASPGSWHSFFGDISISSSGTMFATPDCEEASCRRSVRKAFKLTYRPPYWLSRINFQLLYFSDPLCGPEMRIRLPRTVGWDAPIWKLVVKGDLRGIQELIAKDEASPADVNPNGGSLLHYAADRCYFDICQFLLELGVESTVADCVGGYPTKLVWKYYLMGKLTEDQKIFVRGAFGVDFLLSRQFTVLHKVVLGLANLGLETMLQASTSDINATDAEGRTCLSWAASKADDASVKILLQYGADPNISDNFKHTPLHYVQSAQSCELLLRHGADLEAKEIGGGTPLSLAVSPPGNAAVVDVLLAHDADIHACDNYGDSPPGIAAYNGYENCTIAILEKFNFDIDDAAKLMKVLHIALLYGRDKVFKHLRDSLSNHRIFSSSFIDSLPGSTAGNALLEWFDETRANLSTHVIEQDKMLKYLKRAENDFISISGQCVSTDQDLHLD